MHKEMKEASRWARIAAAGLSILGVVNSQAAHAKFNGDIAGVWHCEWTGVYPGNPTSATYFRYRIALAPNGSFVTRGTAYSRGLGRRFEARGGWHIDRGRLTARQVAVSGKMRVASSFGGPSRPMRFSFRSDIIDGRSMLLSHKAKGPDGREVYNTSSRCTR